MNEQQAIDRLTQYRQKQARLRVLSKYSVGAGITVSRLNEDDHLQELHRKLRRLPSYLYLSSREQRLETTAHAYLTKYPAGTRAQLAAVPNRGADPDDDEELRQIREAIRKVIAARGWDLRDDIDDVLERVAEFQDLKAEIAHIDSVLEALEAYKPEYATLLRSVYVDGKSAGELRNEMNVSVRTFWRRMSEAEREYKLLAR
ncbi:ECF-type sigma factor [Cohnella algarum]|uniref:ECF-type sigma factor n=1 Tax=Cohnella algarum TaxID=2044859 RepID=UPI00196827FC|nr:ECF-type sigma factor [Cohnella algarum]MBN2980135.1 RNA polymerase subunit sigma-24 [Cohnella algarum]